MKNLQDTRIFRNRKTGLSQNDKKDSFAGKYYDSMARCCKKGIKSLGYPHDKADKFFTSLDGASCDLTSSATPPEVTYYENLRES